MATPDINKMGIYNKKMKPDVATAFKTSLFNGAVLSTLLRRCHIFK